MPGPDQPAAEAAGPQTLPLTAAAAALRRTNALVRESTRAACRELASLTEAVQHIEKALTGAAAGGWRGERDACSLAAARARILLNKLDLIEAIRSAASPSGAGPYQKSGNTG
jgi:hypothetical protein